MLTWHPHAQVHRGYLDDPRNTDNAWVETVAISVHFDTQNDVEMKRLNSVRGCPPWRLPGLPHSGSGAQQPVLQTQSSTETLWLHAVGEEHRDEDGVAPQCVSQKGRAGCWGLEVLCSVAGPLPAAHTCDICPLAVPAGL